MLLRRAFLSSSSSRTILAPPPTFISLTICSSYRPSGLCRSSTFKVIPVNSDIAEITMEVVTPQLEQSSAQDQASISINGTSTPSSDKTQTHAIETPSSQQKPMRSTTPTRTIRSLPRRSPATAAAVKANTTSTSIDRRSFSTQSSSSNPTSNVAAQSNAEDQNVNTSKVASVPGANHHPDPSTSSSPAVSARPRTKPLLSKAKASETTKAARTNGISNPSPAVTVPSSSKAGNSDSEEITKEAAPFPPHQESPVPNVTTVQATSTARAMAPAPSRPLNAFASSRGRLDEQIWALYENRRPSRGILKARRKLLDQLEDFMNQQSFSWGHSHDQRENPLAIEPFGSVRFGLASESSDLDMCLFDPYRPEGFTEKYFSSQWRTNALPEIYNPISLANRLRRLRFLRKVSPITGANVPIVKIEAVIDGYVIQGDINTNERLGVINSRLIDSYCELHPMLRPFCIFLKHWARQREINDPSGSQGPTTFSSYTIILLAINYLQHINQLPNLQDQDLIAQTLTEPTRFYSTPKIRRKKIIPSTGWDTTFVEHWDYPGTCYTSQAIQDPDILHNWVKGFFEFYSGEGGFDYNRHIVSIKNGDALERKTPCVDMFAVLETAFGLRNPPNPTVDETANESDPKERLDSTLPPIEQLNLEADKLILTAEDLAQASRTSSPLAYSDEFFEPKAWSSHPLVVQDPFFVERNTAGNIRADVIELIQAEMKRAWTLVDAGLGIEVICQPSQRGLQRPDRVDHRGARGNQQNGRGARGRDNTPGSGRGGGRGGGDRGRGRGNAGRGGSNTTAGAAAGVAVVANGAMITTDQSSEPRNTSDASRGGRPSQRGQRGGHQKPHRQAEGESSQHVDSNSQQPLPPTVARRKTANGVPHGSSQAERTEPDPSRAGPWRRPGGEEIVYRPPGK